MHNMVFVKLTELKLTISLVLPWFVLGFVLDEQKSNNTRRNITWAICQAFGVLQDAQIQIECFDALAASVPHPFFTSSQ